jgi:nitrate/nitrite-specific signal transduction histidine kinase
MVWLGYQDIKNLGLSSQLAEGHPYFQFVEMQSRRIYTALIIAASASAVTSALLMVFITHRIVGPLHRLRSYLSEVARTGKIDSPLTFRKGDYLTDLPEVMNDALMSVRNKSDKSTGKAS